MKLFEYFNSEPRWFSFENPDAKRGAAAKENQMETEIKQEKEIA